MSSGPAPPRGADRRRRPYLLSDWRWAFRGRRRQVRRAEDIARGVCVDRYPARLLPVAIGIFVLSAVDAALTLHLVELGTVREANPFMRPLLGADVHLFVGVKILITAAAVVLMVAYSHVPLFRRVRMERLGHWLLIFYVALVALEAGALVLGAPA